jgi:hypothetical protein
MESDNRSAAEIARLLSKKHHLALATLPLYYQVCWTLTRIAPGLGGYRVGGLRPRAGQRAVDSEFVAQPDAAAERAPGHVPDHLPQEHFEF